MFLNGIPEVGRFMLYNFAINLAFISIKSNACTTQLSNFAD